LGDAIRGASLTRSDLGNQGFEVDMLLNINQWITECIDLVPVFLVSEEVEPDGPMMHGSLIKR